MKNLHIYYRELIYRKYFVIYEFENEKAFFFKIRENNTLKLIKCLKNNSHFYEEALLKLQKIKNDNLTTIDEIFYTSDMNYIKMEFFENSFSLREFLRTYSKKLSFNQFNTILTQMAQVIDLLHENNIAHFDLIYPNILVHKDTYQIKITDFDLIKIITKEHIEYKLVDIYCFVEIVYRLITKLNYIDNVVEFNMSFSKVDLDFSSCKNFLKSLNLNFESKKNDNLQT